MVNFVPDEDLTEKPLIVLLILASVLQTSVAYSLENPPLLANQDIVQLVQCGIPQSVVLKAIELAENEFDVSHGGLLSLRKSGICQRILDAMCRHRK